MEYANEFQFIVNQHLRDELHIIDASKVICHIESPDQKSSECQTREICLTLPLALLYLSFLHSTLMQNLIHLPYLSFFIWLPSNHYTGQLNKLPF